MGNKGEKLSLQQQAFCELYASDKEFFGNGTQSYIEAYDMDMSKPNAYKTAAAAASRLLINVNVLNKINELLELRGLNDAFIDKQLEFLVTQNADLRTKIAAIREYNKLKSRITERLEVTMPTPILGGLSTSNTTDDIKSA
jgi:hypothetical protein